jgi:hypothetical protein
MKDFLDIILENKFNLIMLAVIGTAYIITMLIKRGKK